MPDSTSALQSALLDRAWIQAASTADGGAFGIRSSRPWLRHAESHRDRYAFDARSTPAKGLGRTQPRKALAASYTTVAANPASRPTRTTRQTSSTMGRGVRRTTTITKVSGIRTIAASTSSSGMPVRIVVMTARPLNPAARPIVTNAQRRVSATPLRETSRTPRGDGHIRPAAMAPICFMSSSRSDSDRPSSNTAIETIESPFLTTSSSESGM